MGIEIVDMRRLDWSLGVGRGGRIYSHRPLLRLEDGMDDMGHFCFC